MSDRYLKIKAVSELLSVSVWTVRKWINNRALRSYKFGGAIRIKESDILNFGEERKTLEEIANDIDVFK